MVCNGRAAAVAHFSFTPSGPFFDVTARVPWSNPHEEAASAAPAASSRNAETTEFETRIVVAVVLPLERKVDGKLLSQMNFQRTLVPELHAKTLRGGRDSVHARAGL